LEPLVIASFAWAAGSVYSKHHPQPNSPLLGVAMQCLAGGTALLLAAFLSGELRGFHGGQVTPRFWLALLCLAAVGSGVGFSAYVYLPKHGAPTRVGTYAFVNPVVALFLGWSFAGEPFTLRTMLASTIILAAVLLVITAPHKDSQHADETIPAPGEA
jgi:drug/metabolite transporter (DMT)-like permease